MLRPLTTRPITSLLAAALAGFSIGLLLTALAQMGTTAEASSLQAEQHEQSASPSTKRVFGSDAGIVLNFIKPDKTADFEAVMSKLKEALRKSNKPERKQQAASWKVFRAVEPAGNGSVLYLFTIDPAVKGADYTVSTILAEAFPDDVQALYKQYAESYASGQNFVNLTLVTPFATEISQ
jgi:hypothetical protein